MTTVTSTRASLLARMSEAERGLAVLADRSEAQPAAAGRFALHEASLHESWASAAEAYLAQLPRRGIARCPLTQAEVAIRVDDAGLDGPWWRYDSPLRPLESLPETVIGITGAMRLQPHPERTRFLVVPGPGAPFLLPRLMNDPSVVAVVSSLAVGAHTGFVITYFAPASTHLDPPDSWGANASLRPDGTWFEADDDEDSYDYDLKRWVDAGRVHWIAPDDPAMRLQQGTTGCPYLHVDGPRQVQRLQDGEVW